MGKMVNIGVTISIFFKDNILRGSATSLIMHYLQGLVMIRVTHPREASGYLHSNALTIKIEAGIFL